jgi:LAO/AO transport system kinase
VVILKTAALTGEGVDELLIALTQHRDRQRGTPTFAARRQDQALARIRAILWDTLRRQLDEELDRLGALENAGAEVAARRQDPWTAAEAIARRLKGC